MADLADALRALVTVDSDAKPSSNPDYVEKFDTTVVSRAWESFCRERRRAARAKEAEKASKVRGDSSADSYYIGEVEDRDPLAYSYIHQLWTHKIIVSADQGGYMSVPYKVKYPGTAATDVEFGEPVRVKETFVAASAGETALGRIVAASNNTTESEGILAMSAPPWAKPGATGKKSAEGVEGGLKLKSDPTLGPGHHAITNAQGKRVGVIKKKGDKYTHSQDNHSQTFDSAEGAKKVFAIKHKNSDGSGDGSKTPDGQGDSANKPGNSSSSGSSGASSGGSSSEGKDSTDGKKDDKKNKGFPFGGKK